MHIDDIVDKMSEIIKRLKSSRLLASLRNTNLFQRESSAMNGVEAIVWWEARRIPYNLIVGSAGIVTCVVVGFIAVAAQEFFNSDFGVPDPPFFALFGVILYGILANICFTAGWIVELFLRRFSPRKADRFATNGFFYGVIFSVFLTRAPAALVGVAGTFHLIRHLSAR